MKPKRTTNSELPHSVRAEPVEAHCPSTGSGRSGVNIFSRSYCLFLTSLLLNACAQLAPKEVQAWEKGTLAKTSMQFDADVLMTKLDAHTRFSKEAASGGSTVGGGGCGCN